MKFILFILVFFPICGLASPCSIPTRISFETLEDGSRHASFEIPSVWELESPAIDPNLDEFRARISASVPTSAIELISRQRDFFKKDARIWNRMSQVIDGKLGRIDVAGCLETAVLASVLGAYPENDQVEFSAYVLKSADRYRVHVLTWGLSHVPPSRSCDNLIDQDLKSGWQLNAHVHNHPFFLSNPTGDVAGAVVPSEPDFTAYREQRHARGLERAWVTNGFNTFKMSNSDFDR